MSADAPILGPTGSAASEQILVYAQNSVPRLRERAAEAERQRRLPEATIEEARDSGFFAALVPNHWGGGGVSFSTFLDASRYLAHGCTSSAWTLSFLALHSWLLCRFEPEFQKELFAKRPYALAPAALAPTGKAVTVDGGFRVTGRWEWGTGVLHADWIIVTASLADDPRSIRMYAIPIAEVVVDDVWYTAGMAATGSNAIIVEDVFVPSYRTLIARSPEPTRGQLLHAGTTLDYPVSVTLALVAATPALGAAEAAIEAFIARMKAKLVAYSDGAKQSDQASTHLRLGEAMAATRSAAVLWHEATARLQRLAAGPAPHPVDELAAVRLAAADIVRLANTAINTLAAAAGASAGFLTSPLQRQLRDVQMMRGHVLFDWDRTAQLAGRLALGLPSTPADLL